MINTLAHRVIKYYEGKPECIEHFIKVHSLGKIIGEIEGLNDIDQFIMESAAIVHDVPVENIKEILTELEYCEDDIKRICYIVFGNIEEGNLMECYDYKVMMEAEKIVNIRENSINKDEIENIIDNVLVTQTGKDICRTMYGVSRL